MTEIIKISGVIDKYEAGERPKPDVLIVDDKGKHYRIASWDGFPDPIVHCKPSEQRVTLTAEVKPNPNPQYPSNYIFNELEELRNIEVPPIQRADKIEVEDRGHIRDETPETQLEQYINKIPIAYNWAYKHAKAIDPNLSESSIVMMTCSMSNHRMKAERERM